MFQANQDGAGLAFVSNNIIKVEKGFFDIKTLKKRLKQLTDTEIVLHFRFATHGLTNVAQTHPFVITKNILHAKCKAVEKRIDSVLFHNGVISNYGDKKYSDTLDFVTSTLAHVRTLDAKLNVLDLTGNKFALLDKSGIHLIGNFKLYKGLQCSNLNWLPIAIGNCNPLDTSLDSQSYYAGDNWLDLKVFELQFTGKKHGQINNREHIEYIDALDKHDALDYLRDLYTEIDNIEYLEV